MTVLPSPSTPGGTGRPPQSAAIALHGRQAGTLSDLGDGRFSFSYHAEYDGPAISLTMPVRAEPYLYPSFPPFFDGLLPEGAQLEALLRLAKLDRHDAMGQLLRVGRDLVGAVTATATPTPTATAMATAPRA